MAEERRRTSRTSRIVSGSESGGGVGELASKLSGGMRTVYTGSSAAAGAGDALSAFFGSDGRGWLRALISRGGAAGLARSTAARGKSQEHAEGSARRD